MSTNLVCASSIIIQGFGRVCKKLALYGSLHSEKSKGMDHIQDHLQRSTLPQMMSFLNKQGYAKK